MTTTAADVSRPHCVQYYAMYFTGIIAYLVLTTSWSYFPHFIDKETEDKRH